METDHFIDFDDWQLHIKIWKSRFFLFVWLDNLVFELLSCSTLTRADPHFCKNFYIFFFQRMEACWFNIQTIYLLPKKLKRLYSEWGVLLKLLIRLGEVKENVLKKKTKYLSNIFLKLNTLNRKRKPMI